MWFPDDIKHNPERANFHSPQAAVGYICQIGKQLALACIVGGIGWLLVGCGATIAPLTPTATPQSSPVMVVTPTSSPTATLFQPSPTPIEAKTQPTATASSIETQTQPAATVAPAPAITSVPIRFGFTHQRADGNRLVDGRGRLPEVSPIDIALTGQPQWLVAAPVSNNASVWVAVMDDGQTQAFIITTAGVVTPTLIEPARLPPVTPPLLRVGQGRLSLVTDLNDTASSLTHPILLPTNNTSVSVQANGDLLFGDRTTGVLLPISALPDARILSDETGRLLLYTNPTTRYAHGVLGDALEAAGITLLETEPLPDVVATISIPEPTVAEGIAPIWTDLTGDGRREIIATVSNAQQGAQIVVFNEAGEQIAAGPPIGRGSRWRHQLAVAPFAPDGGLELAAVLTPHIGGVVEFYHLEDNALRIVAQVPGYTSHVLGTRNLDMAAAGDFDGEGQIELLLPNQDRTELGAIRRTAEGAAVAWTIPLNGSLSTNLTGVTLPDGRLMVGAGRNDGILRVWGP